MFYFLMSLLSENPAGGPEMFGLWCDSFIIGTLLYQIIKAFRNRKE